MLALGALVYAAPPRWARPTAAEMARALAAGFGVANPAPGLVAADGGPYARVSWRDHGPRARALIVTPPLRCAWEHGVLYAAYGRRRPPLANVIAECRDLAVMYIDSAPAADARFALELRVGGRRLAPRAARPDATPVALADARGRYYAFANVYFFPLPAAAADAVTVIFTNGTGPHRRRLSLAAFAEAKPGRRAD